MGWQHDGAPDHEGYLIAVVREDELSADGRTVMATRYRELTGLVRDEEAQRQHDGARISVVQVGCDCGWRSMRIAAPPGTTWRPLIVLLPRDEEEAFEELAHELWSAHIREHGSVDMYDALPGAIAHTTRNRDSHGRVERLERYVLVERGQHTPRSWW